MACKQEHHGVVMNALGWACCLRLRAQESDFTQTTLSFLPRRGTEASICIHATASASSFPNASADDEFDLLPPPPPPLPLPTKQMECNGGAALEREIYAKSKEIVKTPEAAES